MSLLLLRSIAGLSTAATGDCSTRGSPCAGSLADMRVAPTADSPSADRSLDIHTLSHPTRFWHFCLATLRATVAIIELSWRTRATASPVARQAGVPPTPRRCDLCLKKFCEAMTTRSLSLIRNLIQRIFVSQRQESLSPCDDDNFVPASIVPTFIQWRVCLYHAHTPVIRIALTRSLSLAIRRGLENFESNFRADLWFKVIFGIRKSKYEARFSNLLPIIVVNLFLISWVFLSQCSSMK